MRARIWRYASIKESLMVGADLFTDTSSGGHETAFDLSHCQVSLKLRFRCSVGSTELFGHEVLNFL